MVQPFSSGSIGASVSGTGFVNSSVTNISLNYGIEKPKGLYAYSKVSASDQYLNNFETGKNFYTKVYPSFCGGVGFNRKDEGFFADVVSEYKVGVDNTTKGLSEVGTVFDAKAGQRIQRPNAPSLYNEVGAYVRSESYSARGHNRNYDNTGIGAFFSTDLPNNFQLTFNGGIQQNSNSEIAPAFGVKAIYRFGK